MSVFLSFDLDLDPKTKKKKTETSLSSSLSPSLPLAPPILSATFCRSIPRTRFIFLEWIRRMSTREDSEGLGNSIFLSMRPGRSSAASRMSILLVAMSTLILFVDSKPSSWLRSSSMVRWTSESPPPPPEPPRAEPMESTCC